MKLVPYDIKKIEKGFYARSENLRLLTEFTESNMDCAIVDNYAHKNANYCSTALNVSIKRYGIAGIKSIVRNGVVYLIKVKD